MMNFNVLVTGSKGFTGKVLVRTLKKKKFKVLTLDCDITRKKELANFIKDMEFDFVVHLAAISNVAFPDSYKINKVNIEGTRNLLSILNNTSTPPKLVIVPSSAYVYGIPESGILSESSKLQPSNAYGRSKLEMEKLCGDFEKLTILITRPFNYTGIGQGKSFLIPKIVDHFTLRKKEIQLGNINIQREFNDVRDVCEIYTKFLENVKCSDIVNICSGQSYSIKNIINTCENLTGHKIKIRIDNSLKRNVDIPNIVGNPKKMQSMVGTHIFQNLENILKTMLSDTN